MATINKITDIQLNESLAKKYLLGLKPLDKALNGINEGTIITIGARPSMGKSNFMNNILLNLMDNYNVPTLYVNLEMSKEKSALRLATLSKGEKFSEIQKNETFMKETMSEYTKKDYNLYLSDDCFTVEELEQLINENGIKFVIIDYIQLLKSSQKSSSSIDNYNEVLDKIRALANQKKLIVFLLSQISRNVEHRENSRPLLMDLKNSGNLESNSDIVLFLYRKSYYSSENKNNILEIIIAKNRYGSMDTVYLDYDPQKENFINY